MSLIDEILMTERKKHGAEPHFYPFKYWKSRWNKSDDQTKKWLELGVKNGLMKKRMFKILNAAGSRVNVAHWADVKKLKKS